MKHHKVRSKYDNVWAEGARKKERETSMCILDLSFSLSIFWLTRVG